MIPIDYRTRHPLEDRREQLAGQVEQYLAAGGEIHVIPGIEQRLDQPYQWNRNDLILSGSSLSSPEENRVAAAVRRIRELAENGAGITAMKMDLRMDSSRIKRIAAEHGIEIRHSTAQQRVIGEKARNACVDAGKLRRSKLAPVIRKLCAESLTIAQIATRAETSTTTVLRIIDEYQIQRARHEQ
ncbi:hypothetical protein DK254_00060 [Pseudomonas sp. RW407]|nr:hypothetical protein DK254_11480 [Pseudomonas sp. RW407]PWU32117.1 hypothetical protein DK254_00060 [Pseudomonas sp. RW407]